MKYIELIPIGTIFTPFEAVKDAPHQVIAAKGVKGMVKILPKYIESLSGLDKHPYIYLLYYFHKSRGFSPIVVPRNKKTKTGLFATRSPSRPNPIGLSLVHLEKVEDNILHITDVDMINSTPLLDIKPYIPSLDLP
jgi:tRNA-Thr(GGU) m(6)t(6)A37 methyltransferase TsaA